MKKNLFALLICLPLVCGFAAVGTASGQERTVRITRFEGASIRSVHVSSAINVELVNSSSTGVVAEVSEGLQQYLEMNMRSDGILEISRKPSGGRNLRGTIKVTVSTPRVEVIRAVGASSVTCQSYFTGDRLNVTLTGASALKDLQHTARGDVNVNCTGASSVRNLRVSGSGIDITASGASTLAESVVWADRALQVSAAGGSSVKGEFSCNGEIRFAVSGVSTSEVEMTSTGKAAVNVSGGSRMTGGIRCGSFAGTVVGASTLRASLPGSPEVGLKVLTGSSASISGNAHRMELEVTGASRLNGGDFSVNICNARLTGGSSVELNVKSELTVDASGSSLFRYGGNPRLNSTATGGSGVRKK